MTQRDYILRTADIQANCLRYISSLRPDTEHPLQVTVKPYTKKRSTEQNSRYWAWLTVIADEAARTGLTQKRYSPEHWHEFFKREFLGQKVMIDGDVYLLPESSANKGVKRFSEYCDQVDQWAAEHGIIIPDMHGEL